MPTSQALDQLVSNVAKMKAPIKPPERLRSGGRAADSDPASFQKALEDAKPKKPDAAPADQPNPTDAVAKPTKKTKKADQSTDSPVEEQPATDEQPVENDSTSVAQDQPEEVQSSDETEPAQDPKPEESPKTDKPDEAIALQRQQQQEQAIISQPVSAKTTEQPKKPAEDDPGPARPVATSSASSDVKVPKPAEAPQSKPQPQQGQRAQSQKDGPTVQQLVTAQQSEEKDADSAPAPQQQQPEAKPIPANSVPTEPPARKVATIAPQPTQDEPAVAAKTVKQQPSQDKAPADAMSQQVEQQQLPDATQQTGDESTDRKSSATSSSGAALVGVNEIATAKSTPPGVSSAAPQAAVPQRPAPEADFAAANHDQIVSSVRTQLLPNGGTMHMRLDPPELGVLQVTVRMVDGAMTASFETSNDHATNLLSHSLGQLKTALEAQGVNVEKIHVQQSPRDQQADSRSSDEQNRQQRADDQSSARQDQQRREMLRRMWRRLGVGSDPLDMVA